MIVEVKLWNTTVGYLSTDDNNIIYFTYDKSFVERGIEISPLTLKLRNEPYSFPMLRSETYRGLPGLFADSLPDKFGRKVINEYLLANGIDKSSFTPLQELCYLGKRGMGALEYYPLLDESMNDSEIIEISKIALAAKEVLSNRLDKEMKPEIGRLRDIIKIGSSAGGAKAKAIIAYNEETKTFKSGQIDAGKGFSYWIIKFDKLDKEDLNSFFDNYQTREEYAYYLMAKDAGINISESKLIKEGSDYHFMTKRFDRYIDDKGKLQKLHVQTLCGLTHIDYQDKHTFSYSTIFEVMEQLNIDFEERYQLFRRMVFNIVASNNDDHSKNFSFLMDRNGEWHLSPAYDITYANDPTSSYINNHQALINGKSFDINIDDVLAVGEKAGLNNKKMLYIIEEVETSVKKWFLFAKSSELPENKAKENYYNFHFLNK